jgi:hypothetical protein
LRLRRNFDPKQNLSFAETESVVKNMVRLLLALLEDWRCEAAYDHSLDNKLVKQAARTGIAAAREALKLDPNSSDAHWVHSDL